MSYIEFLRAYCNKVTGFWQKHIVLAILVCGLLRDLGMWSNDV